MAKKKQQPVKPLVYRPVARLAWYNFRTRVYEAYKFPQTDQDALDHLPQEEYIATMYRAYRAQGMGILLAMRETLIKTEEVESGQDTKRAD
jgi:hypothetical protein